MTIEAAKKRTGVDQAAGRRPGGWRLAFWILAALALFPGLVQFVRAETARWYFALCYEAELNGKSELANRHLANALKWNPTDQHARRYRLSALVRQGKATDALADAEQALNDARERFLNMPNHMTRGQLAAALNEAAYFSGLSDIALDKALERIDEALELSADPTNSAMLDTRGYILWRLGESEEALAEIEKAIEEHKYEYRVTKRLVEQQGTYVVDDRSLKRDLQRVDHGMATLYYHRALVNESLGNTLKAEKDFQRITNLGFDPEDGLY